MLRQPTGFWGLFATDMIVRAAYQMAKSPVLPILAASLGANKLMIGTIVGVSTLTGTVFKPLVGMLSDRYGRRLFFFTALVLFCVFPFLYRFVQTPNDLFWLRILHGFATAIFGPVTLAIVTEMSTANRGTRLGVFEMARGSGHLIAPAVAGFIMAWSSPRGGVHRRRPVELRRLRAGAVRALRRLQARGDGASELLRRADRRREACRDTARALVRGRARVRDLRLDLLAEGVPADLRDGSGLRRLGGGPLLHLPGSDAPAGAAVRRPHGRPARLCADHRARPDRDRRGADRRCPRRRRRACCWASPSWSASARASPSPRPWR